MISSESNFEQTYCLLSFYKVFDKYHPNIEDPSIACIIGNMSQLHQVMTVFCFLVRSLICPCHVLHFFLSFPIFWLSCIIQQDSIFWLSCILVVFWFYSSSILVVFFVVFRLSCT